ncbi:MAG: sigma D regulator [Gammaproteobacteria bacterium]|nr:sigma D regulator [Gammaproteobacteria bacterium]
MSEERVESGERRTRTSDMVDKLLIERQEMLTLFCQTAGLEPYTQGEIDRGRLRRFCQVLMDYMAFGHFEIIARISRGEEKRASVVTVAEGVYEKILEATEYAVAFNDKYDSPAQDEFGQLEHDLSILGEELAVRIEMEDRLVAAMMA